MNLRDTTMETTNWLLLSILTELIFLIGLTGFLIGLELS